MAVMVASKGSIWRRILRRLKEYYQEACFQWRTRIYLPRSARSAISKVRGSQRRGIFLDCGSNVGQGFQFFSQYFPADYFDYELFEPNPFCQEHLQSLRTAHPSYSMNIHQKAISTNDQALKFYGLSEPDGFGPLSQGGSTLKSHSSMYYQADESSALIVEGLDFVAFLQEVLSRYSVVVIKMDIEGAEYEVLEKLLDTGSLARVHSLFVEFHSQYMDGRTRPKYQAWEKKLMRRIRQSGCRTVLWR